MDSKTQNVLDATRGLTDRDVDKQAEFVDVSNVTSLSSQQVQDGAAELRGRGLITRNLDACHLTEAGAVDPDKKDQPKA